MAQLRDVVTSGIRYENLLPQRQHRVWVGIDTFAIWIVPGFEAS
ncbi:MAG: hypothetical protein WKF82_04720 [Nocardioidaceae bacterium]